MCGNQTERGLAALKASAEIAELERGGAQLRIVSEATKAALEESDSALARAQLRFWFEDAALARKEAGRA